MSKFYQNSKALWTFKIVLLLLGFLSASICLAAAPSGHDALQELSSIIEDTRKITKNFSYIIGCGSVVVAILVAVATQNLKALAVGSLVSILAFKAPGYLVATALLP